MCRRISAGQGRYLSFEGYCVGGVDGTQKALYTFFVFSHSNIVFWVYSPFLIFTVGEVPSPTNITSSSIICQKQRENEQGLRGSWIKIYRYDNCAYFGCNISTERCLYDLEKIVFGIIRSRHSIKMQEFVSVLTLYVPGNKKDLNRIKGI